MGHETYPETSLPAAGSILRQPDQSVEPSQQSDTLVGWVLTWFRSGQTTSLLASETEKELVREALGGIAMHAPLPDTAAAATDPASKLA